MKYSQDTLAEAKSQLKFLLRQMDPMVPAKAPTNERLRTIIDEQTAQILYEEIIEELEQSSGFQIKPTD